MVNRKRYSHIQSNGLTVKPHGCSGFTAHLEEHCRRQKKSIPMALFDLNNSAESHGIFAVMAFVVR